MPKQLLHLSSRCLSVTMAVALLAGCTSQPDAPPTPGTAVPTTQSADPAASPRISSEELDGQPWPMSPTAEYTVRRMSARYIRELVSGPSRQATLKRLQAKPVPPGKPGVDFSQDIRVNRPHAWYGTGSNDWNHQGTIHGGITLIRRSAFTDYPTTGPSDPARSPRRYLITVELGDLEEPYPVKLKPEQHVFVHWNGERETRASFEASIGDGSAAGTPHSVVKRIQLANPDTGLSTCVDWTDQALAAGGYSSPFDLAMLPALIPQPVSDGRGACGLPVT